MKRHVLLWLMAALGSCAALAETAAAQGQGDGVQVPAIYAERQTTELVLHVEAALALAQAEHGMIPAAAALEICELAALEYIPEAALAEEYSIVRHRMIALLNVWRRSLSPAAAEAVHFGATTVDIYDTVAMLQLRASIDATIARLQRIEDALIPLAHAHRATPMIGRTLGQHALPITFGKKLSVWIDENRRNIARLIELRARVNRSAIMKGAVGSYLGLGEDAIAIEASFAARLGFEPPYPADWHGARDVMAEYAAVMVVIAGAWERFGQEMFLLQSTDIAEVRESLSPGALGSSTMPHKTNPSLSEALMHHGRVVPRLAMIVIDDGVNFFERDNTSRSNDAIGELAIAADQMLRDAARLIGRLEVDTGAMRANLDRTGGRILSQRVVFALAPALGRLEAEEAVREAVDLSGRAPEGFRAALLADGRIAAHLTPAALDALLDPTTYLGLAAEQVDATIEAARAARAADPVLTHEFSRPVCRIG